MRCALPHQVSSPLRSTIKVKVVFSPGDFILIRFPPGILALGYDEFDVMLDEAPMFVVTTPAQLMQIQFLPPTHLY